MSSRNAAPPADEPSPVALGIKAVRALLARHGVPPARQSAEVAEILGLSYAQAHRRLGGSVAWELEELQAVARHYGESLAEVLRDDEADEEVPAVLVVGAVRVACRLVPGERLADPPLNSLVALRAADQWLVMAAPDAGAAACHFVRRLSLSPAPARPRRIAVLDDHAGLAKSIASHLNDAGFEAASFTDAPSLAAALQHASFDAFVIDWVLGNGSAVELVRTIRAADRHCPIVVLTGKMKSDLHVETDVAAAISNYKLLLFEKPFRVAIMSAALSQALSNR